MDLLDRLLGHDAWTTDLLLRRSAELGDEQLDRMFDIGRRTLRATLGHIVRNTDAWSALMQAGLDANASPPGSTTLQSHARGARPVEHTTIDSLIELHLKASARLAHLARTVADRNAWDEVWLDTLDEPPSRKTYGGAIAHVITHSMHHRAQVLHMMRRLGLTDLPEGDVLSWEHRRTPR